MLVKYKNGETDDIKFYSTWTEINRRCKSFPDYIKRGTIVCERWSNKNPNGYINFYNDIYESYIIHKDTHGAKNTSIDRINNNGNYEPENCRWATWKIQSRNTKIQKPFIAIDKDGNIEEWKVIKDFCEYHKFYKSNDMVGHCLRGKVESWKGWKFKYI